MTIRICAWLVLGALGLAATGAGSAASNQQDAGDKPWLVPPHILEFTGPLLRVFGTNTTFGARVTVSHADDVKGVKPSEGLVLFRDGNTVFEPGSAPIKAPRARRKDHQGDFGFLIVGLMDKGTSYVISEGVSGYTEVPTRIRPDASVAVETQDLGRERVAGFDCQKKAVAVSQEGSEPQSFVVWYAPKLRGFPIKIERRLGGPRMVFLFSQIRFERPNDSLFTSPAEGYTRYDTLNSMTEEMTRRVWNVMQRPSQSIAFPPGSTTTRPGYTPSY